MSVEATITALVAALIEAEPDEVPPEAHLFKDLAMDSVLAIDLVTDLEKQFGIAIPDERMKELTSVRAIASIVEGYLAGAKAST